MGQCPTVAKQCNFPSPAVASVPVVNQCLNTNDSLPDGTANSATSSESNVSLQSAREGLVPYRGCDTVRELVFEQLICIFNIICEAVSSQSAEESKKKSYVSLFDFDSSAFAGYFQALRYALTGSQEQKSLITGIHEHLIRLLFEIDDEGRNECRPPADIAKGEIILLLETMYERYGKDLSGVLLQISSDSGTSANGDHETGSRHYQERRRFNKRDCWDGATKLLEMYVLSGREHETYNLKYTSHYYKLLLLLADHHGNFKEQLLRHNNWTWALGALVFGPFGCESGPLYEHLFCGTMAYIKENKQFRKAIVAKLSQQSPADGGVQSFINHNRIEASSLKMLKATFDNDTELSQEDSCLNHFTEEYDGLSQLSCAALKFHKKVEERLVNGSSSETALLEGLHLSLECLFIVLDSCDMNKVRSLISNWADVNDVNCLCTQLITRSEEEWDKCLGGTTAKAGPRKTEVTQLISRATGLQEKLASAEAVEQAEVRESEP
mmetsp:Transcript_21505/g.62962  ORF Transcript_21505/g.62962 Transcript_21505/m.62962 type:complete len:496 (+) Transcript_21505:3858-5345(+)